MKVSKNNQCHLKSHVCTPVVHIQCTIKQSTNALTTSTQTLLSSEPGWAMHTWERSHNSARWDSDCILKKRPSSKFHHVLWRKGCQLTTSVFHLPWKRQHLLCLEREQRRQADSHQCLLLQLLISAKAVLLHVWTLVAPMPQTRRDMISQKQPCFKVLQMLAS